MSSSTSCGEASVALMAQTFGLSRQAVYAARAARQEAARTAGLPHGDRPRTAPAAPP